MSETTATLPPLTEAMTAKDLAAHRSAMSALVPGMTTFVHAFSGAPENAACVSLYRVTGGSIDQPFYAPTWPEAFALARAWVATHSTVHRDNRIRAMALAIIDLTDQFGRCDRAMLTRREFSGAEIDALTDAACQRAGELAGNAPFSVEG